MNSLQKSEKSGANGGLISADTLEQRIREVDPLSSLVSPDDISAGRLFARIYGDVAKYNTTSRSWWFYDGEAWREDCGSVRVELAAQQMQRALLIFAARNQGDDYTQRDKNFLRFCASLGRRYTREAMLRDAASHTFFSTEDLDKNPNLLNLHNGTLDLESGKLREHDSRDLCSMIAPVDYIEGKRSERWERFISEVMEGDSEKAGYLQRLCGYFLTTSTSDEAFYLVYGASTRNGKSCFTETLAAMLGDYCVNMSADSLALRNRDARGTSSDLARLKGRRLAHISEPPKRMPLDAALLKTLTGGDRLTARNPYQLEQEFTLVCKFLINTNYLPAVSDDTLFESGRVRVIPFTKHFEPTEQDRSLKATLRKPENLSGVLSWCLDGLRKVQESGLDAPKVVSIATSDYRLSSDRIGQFISECLEEDTDGRIRGKDVYQRYSRWCEQSGYATPGLQSFYDDLRQKGMLHTARIDGKPTRNVVTGFKLTIDQSEFQSTDNAPFF